jgi:hypothetical protein
LLNPLLAAFLLIAYDLLWKGFSTKLGEPRDLGGLNELGFMARWRFCLLL